MQIIMLLSEFIQDIRAQKLRAFLTTVAITWGTLAIILLMAFGAGMAFRLQEGLLNAGNRIIRIYGGQTTKKYRGLPIGRRIRLVEDDARVLMESIPMIAAVNPGLGRFIRLRNGDRTASTYMEGVYPPFEDLRRTYPGAGGRFINALDMQYRKRVVFLGSVIARELFGDREPIGQMVTIEGIPFKVIGIMPKKLQTSMNNGPDDRRAIIPFTTFQSIYGYKYLRELIVKPSRPEYAAFVEKEVRRVLGKKYKFDPTDERAVPMWNFIEEEEISRRIFLGINIFLGVIGAMTLIIAGVGVANIMYVVVKERTREIGIRRAVGAQRRHIILQFVFESMLIALIGGSAGILLAVLIVKIIWSFPADGGAMQFLGRPIMSQFVMLTAVSLLAVIGLFAGLFPARKAASIDPVEALRYE